MYEILIISDVWLYREGLAYLLRERENIRVLDTAANQEEANAAIDAASPEIILVDLSMSDALGVIQRLARRLPEARIIALALPELDNTVIACAEVGIAGYVTRDSSIEELLNVIASATNGELQCSPRVAGSLLRRVSALAKRCQTASIDSLTARELEVLDRIERGLSNKQIANDLGIELSTAKNHVHNLLDKLGVRRRGEAAALLRSGLPRARSRFRSRSDAGGQAMRILSTGSSDYGRA